MTLLHTCRLACVNLKTWWQFGSGFYYQIFIEKSGSSEEEKCRFSTIWTRFGTSLMSLVKAKTSHHFWPPNTDGYHIIVLKYPASLPGLNSSMNSVFNAFFAVDLWGSEAWWCADACGDETRRVLREPEEAAACRVCVCLEGVAEWATFVRVLTPTWGHAVGVSNRTNTRVSHLFFLPMNGSVWHRASIINRPPCDISRRAATFFLEDAGVRGAKSFANRMSCMNSRSFPEKLRNLVIWKEQENC